MRRTTIIPTWHGELTRFMTESVPILLINADGSVNDGIAHNLGVRPLQTFIKEFPAGKSDSNVVPVPD